MNKKELKRFASTKPCSHCGVPFYMCPGHRARHKNNFCSRDCNAKFHTGENHKAYNAELHVKNCLTCNNEVTRARSKYCSSKCQGEGAKGEKSARYNKKSVSCSNCKKDILKQPSLISGTNFCSSNCKNTFHSKRISAANNPRYKDGCFVGRKGIKGIYIGFTLKLKIFIRERDGNSCKVCGMDEKTHGLKMHVHHIDYNKEHNIDINLISVCRYCHGKIHGDESKWQKILSKV